MSSTLTEPSICMEAWEILATLAGKKTVFRRLVEAAPGYQRSWLSLKTIANVRRFADAGNGAWTMAVGEPSRFEHCGHVMDGGHIGTVFSPYGVPGETLIVREKWRPEERASDLVDGICFKADRAFIPIENTREAADRWMATLKPGTPADRKNPWRKPRQMPAWASRFKPLVMSVRIEWLHEITDVDARMEGVEPFFERFDCIGREQCITTGERAADAEYRASYAVSWDEMYGDRVLWLKNPPVWRVEYAMETT